MRIVDEFIVLVKPWLDLVNSTKDLKLVRKADYTQELLHWLNYLSVVSDAEGRWFLRINLIELRDIIFLSSVGSRRIREDLWRRLAYMELMLSRELRNG